MTLGVINAGEEQMPKDAAERAEVYRLQTANSGMMNTIFKDYFGLDPCDRYMGSFPYPDRDTGQASVSIVLTMTSNTMRDAIVACLRTAILEAGLADIAVHESDQSPQAKGERRYRWPAEMKIVVMGPSIHDTLVAEQRIHAALTHLEEWLSRIQRQ